MSLSIKYETVEDAQMRLRNTVVLYEGEPVIVRGVSRSDRDDDILRVIFDPLPIKREGAFYDDPVEGAQKRKYISSKHFDIAPFKLGYVNAPTGAFFCSRFPNRIQKQGLCSENFRAYTNEGQQVGWGTFIRTKEVVAMVKGEYPSFEVAIKALKKSPSVAFSRDFCVERDEILEELVHIYHKGKKVGAYMGGGVILGKAFGCLRESLTELGLKVN